MRQMVGVSLMLVLASVSVAAQEAGQDLYAQRCFWCHGEEGRGDGPSAVGMFPRPRNLVEAEYKIRSTPAGQLPTDEDLFRVISRGLPGTPMPQWESVLTEEERRQLVSYVKSLSPRFQSETSETLDVPSAEGFPERGREVYRRARCFVCHGEAGRADGGLVTALNFEWGRPYWARDFTRSWTFKGGQEAQDIYLRITGGLAGTPMGPYQELLSDQERWDLAHYVASLDEESQETSDDFVVEAEYVQGEIPDLPEAQQWQSARSILVPLAGVDVREKSWGAIPTVGSLSVKALWNGERIGFLLGWNDPTGPQNALPDSAYLQFATLDASKPYFLFGGDDDPVKIWQWHEGDAGEEWTAAGGDQVQAQRMSFSGNSSWDQGRWRVILQGPLASEPTFGIGQFVPVLFSVRDGANAEFGETGAISTWLYTTLERPPSVRPWLSALVWLLGALVAEVWIVLRLQS